MFQNIHKMFQNIHKMFHMTNKSCEFNGSGTEQTTCEHNSHSLYFYSMAETAAAAAAAAAIYHQTSGFCVWGDWPHIRYTWLPLDKG